MTAKSTNVHCNICYRRRHAALPAALTTGNSPVHSSDRDRRAAERDPEPWLQAWHRAASAFSAAADAEREVEKAYRAAGSGPKPALSAALNAARVAHCSAIAAMWLLPHPSEFNNSETSPWLRKQRRLDRARRPLTLGL